jgi:hypothetical protein
MMFLSVLLVFRLQTLLASTAATQIMVSDNNIVKRNLCLRPVSIRSRAFDKVLQATSKRERKVGELHIQVKRNGLGTCWKATYRANSIRSFLNSTTYYDSNRQMIIPDVVDLIFSSRIAPRTRTMKGASWQVPPYPQQSASPRFKLVWRQDSAVSTALMARKLNLLGQSIKLSQSLSDLLDTTIPQHPSMVHQNRGQFSKLVVKGTDAIVGVDSRNGESDEFLNQIHGPNEVTSLQSTNPRDQVNVFSIPGCGHPSSVAHSKVDLSGKWKPIITNGFLVAYDNFLQSCGESYWMRKLLVNALSMQSQQIRQLDGGRRLEIVDMHPMASWNRTLVSSGNNTTENSFQPFKEVVNQLMDPQGDALQVVAYWCEDGTVHKSVLQSSKPHWIGAWLESYRFLESSDLNDSQGSSPNPILVSKAIFHPPPNNNNNNIKHARKMRPASLTWRYEQTRG